MFRVSQRPSSGVLKTVPAASGTGHTTCTATPLLRGLILHAYLLTYLLLTDVLNCLVTYLLYLLTYLLIYSMEQSPSLEAGRYSSSQ